MLVIGLKGGGAAQEEELGRGTVLVVIGGPVIVDLVIIPGDDEGRRRVDGHQVRIGLIEGIAVSIVGKRIGLAAPMAPHPPCPLAANARPRRCSPQHDR